MDLAMLNVPSPYHDSLESILHEGPGLADAVDGGGTETHEFRG